ncbi:hypothetical protein GGD54_003481 [Rhizobium tropici]|uniref:Uncharacterized protein n=1 Tax=Rhizobium tropici TaxID=398 RepID=A0ABR6R1K1_RHITR|nr:hypothetical protein [Rhizobium tropici]MBB5594363.1 hypothetical protein [Rhizobium tropici]MBB6493057.1 hypothetical protein [Rhizobium tropici]
MVSTLRQRGALVTGWELVASAQENPAEVKMGGFDAR